MKSYLKKNKNYILKEHININENIDFRGIGRDTNGNPTYLLIVNSKNKIIQQCYGLSRQNIDEIVRNGLNKQTINYIIEHIGSI